jgi:hypothetical protein
MLPVAAWACILAACTLKAVANTLQAVANSPFNMEAATAGCSVLPVAHCSVATIHQQDIVPLYPGALWGVQLASRILLLSASPQQDRGGVLEAARLHLPQLFERCGSGAHQEIGSTNGERQQVWQQQQQQQCTANLKSLL